MALHVNNLGAVISQWIDEELLSKATGWQKALTIMAGIGITNNLTNIVSSYLPVLQVLGYADSNGNLNLDAIADAAKVAFTKTGKLPLPLGIIVDVSDVNSLVELARKFEVQNG